MPAWIASALSLLFGTPARATLTGIAGGVAGQQIFGGGGERLGDILGGDGRPRRRRRRRSLTASDRADIAFIAGMLGQPAGRQFAMLIGARTAT